MATLAWIVVTCIAVWVVMAVIVALTFDAGPDWLAGLAMWLGKAAFVVGSFALVGGAG